MASMCPNKKELYKTHSEFFKNALKNRISTLFNF